MDQYLDAVAAHDPKLVLLAKNVKFTENGQKLVIPDGLWNSMVGKGTYRLFVDDPQAGSVAFIGTIKEEGRTPSEPVAGVIALRLKLEGRQISEVETFVVRNPQTAERLHPNDLTRVSRALEVYELTGRPISVWHREHGFAVPRSFRSH